MTPQTHSPAAGGAGYLFKTECKWHNESQCDSQQWRSNLQDIFKRSILTQFRLIRLLSGSKNKTIPTDFVETRYVMCFVETLRYTCFVEICYIIRVLLKHVT